MSEKNSEGKTKRKKKTELELCKPECKQALREALKQQNEKNKDLISFDDLPKNVKETEGGYYKWWASKERIKEILKLIDRDTDTKQPITLESIESEMEKKKYEGKEVYCFYVGQAKNLKKRLVGCHHAKNLSRSTLRRTIGCLLDFNLKYDNEKDLDREHATVKFKLKDIREQVENAISDFMTGFEISFYTISEKDPDYKTWVGWLPAKDPKSKKKDVKRVLDMFEYEVINRKAHILNIDGNYYKDENGNLNDTVQKIVAKLKEKREELGEDPENSDEEPEEE